MFKRSYLIVLLSLLFLALAVKADEATITVSLSEETNIPFISNLGPTTPTATADLGSVFFAQELAVSVDLPRCRWFGYNCGTINLCAAFAGTSQCKRLQHRASQTVVFEANQLVREIEFSYTGSRNIGFFGTQNQLTITNIKVIGSDFVEIDRNLLSLRGTGPINLGRVREIISVTGFTGEVAVSSNDLRAVAWFDDGIGPSNTSNTTTSIHNDFIYACLNVDTTVDTEGNPLCDYEDELECAEQNKDWFDGHCCGDAPYNPTTGCQWYDDKQAVCGKNSQGIFTWAALADVGLINILSGDCPSVQLVSDGSRFYTCSSIPPIIPAGTVTSLTGKITIEGHEYVCDEEEIIECGGDAPYSPNAKLTGASITYNNQKHYCTSDGKWVVSLDGTDEESCEAAGFGWTGTKCCGEDDDELKTFEDAGGLGGCFNNEFIESGDFLEEKSIINYQGEFYVCLEEALPEADVFFQGTGITPESSDACGTPLENALPFGNKPHIICSPQGDWLFTDSTGEHFAKSTAWVPLQTEQGEGCCPDNRCWDGKTCREIGEYHVVGEKGFRCDEVASADWVEVNIRYNWDRKSIGFCNEQSQCLVSNAFNEAWDNFPNRYWSETLNENKPKCINHTQYIADNYCDMGDWSSRTKLVATQLLAVALDKSTTNFSIYCDSYDKVLNRYDYRTDFGPVTTFIRRFCPQPGNKRVNDCVNNICVMRYGNNVAFGTAINTDISGEKSPLQALNLSSTECDEAKNDDEDYDACGFGVWYNHNTESLLYAPGISPLPPPEPLVQDFFMTPYNRLKNYVFTVVHNPDIAQYNYTFFNFTPQFKQVYMAKDDIDFVYSFRQPNVTLTQIDYAGFYFSNINLPADTCSRIIKRYDDRANCELQPSPAEFFIAAHKTPPVNRFDIRKSIVDAWNEMTGKLRVSP